MGTTLISTLFIQSTKRYLWMQKLPLVLLVSAFIVLSHSDCRAGTIDSAVLVEANKSYSKSDIVRFSIYDSLNRWIDVDSIIITIDGVDFKHAARFERREKDTLAVSFNLDTISSNFAQWKSVVHSFRFCINVPVDLKYPPAKSVIHIPQALRLQTIGIVEFAVITFFIICILFLIVRLGSRTNLLRDLNSDPNSQSRPPYSLARIQMAWWFVIVLTVVLYYWMFYATLVDLPTYIIWLIGISAATLTSAQFTDATQIQTSKSQHADLVAERAMLLSKRLHLNKSRFARSAQSHSELISLEGQIMTNMVKQGYLSNTLANPSTHEWWRDILQDGEGYSFHRFQVVTWTFVLSVIFFYNFLHNLNLISFSDNYLLLMGISNGTYVGFKLWSK